MTGTIFLRSLEKLNLLEDHNKKIFEDKLKTYRNRLPLGGIKTPFNLESSIDYYTAPCEEVFHCYSITSGSTKLQEILALVKSQFGDISESIVYGDTIEFFFNLVREEQMKEFKEKLDKFGGAYVRRFFSPRP